MSVRNQVITWALAAGGDLDDLTAGTGDLFKGVAADDGLVAVNGAECSGILIEGAKSGENISIAVSGLSKFVAGATVVAGARLTCKAAGYFITATSGSYVNGRALSAVTSGSVGIGHFDFAVPRYAVSSLL